MGMVCGYRYRYDVGNIWHDRLCGLPKCNGKRSLILYMDMDGRLVYGYGYGHGHRYWCAWMEGKKWIRARMGVWMDKDMEVGLDAGMDVDMDVKMDAGIDVALDLDVDVDIDMVADENRQWMWRRAWEWI